MQHGPLYLYPHWSGLVAFTSTKIPHARQAHGIKEHPCAQCIAHRASTLEARWPQMDGAWASKTPTAARVQAPTPEPA
jgi:hypothetical protein